MKNNLVVTVGFLSLVGLIGYILATMLSFDSPNQGGEGNYDKTDFNSNSRVTRGGPIVKSGDPTRKGGIDNSGRLSSAYEKLCFEWDNLNSEDADVERRSALARESAEKLLFSREMMDLIAYLKKNKISTGNLSIQGELAMLFKTEYRDKALISLFDNLAVLNELWNKGGILEAAGVSVADTDANPSRYLEVLAREDTGKAKSFYMGWARENAKIETISDIFNIKDAMGNYSFELNKAEVSMIIDGYMPVESNVYVEQYKMLIEGSTEKQNPSAELVAEGFLRDWASKHAQEALREWQANPRDETSGSFDALIEGMISGYDYADVSAHIDTITKESFADKARAKAAISSASLDERISNSFIDKIKDQDLKRKTLKEVHSIVDTRLIESSGGN